MTRAICETRTAPTTCTPTTCTCRACRCCANWPANRRAQKYTILLTDTSLSFLQALVQSGALTTLSRCDLFRMRPAPRDCAVPDSSMFIDNDSADDTNVQYMNVVSLAVQFANNILSTLGNRCVLSIPRLNDCCQASRRATPCEKCSYSSASRSTVSASHSIRRRTRAAAPRSRR